MLKLRKLIDRIVFYLYYKNQYQKMFKSYGRNIKWGRDANFLIIPNSIRISCPNLISIGNDVQIDEGVYLQSHRDGGGIHIGDGSRINSHTHIQAYSKVTISNKVLIAPFSLVNSGKHGDGESCPIMDQKYIEAGEIIINSGCWLGHSVKVLGGSEVARNTTVAAGAIVNKKFLKENSTLVGVPAREI